MRSSLVVIGLRAFEDDARLQVILQVLADAGQLVHDRDAEAAAAARAGPTPESCSSCGDCIAPAAQQDFAAQRRGACLALACR